MSKKANQGQKGWYYNQAPMTYYLIKALDPENNSHESFDEWALSTLLKRYNINFENNDEKWKELSLALAKEHLPSFQKSKKVGRKSADANKYIIWVEVELLKANKTVSSNRSAIKYLLNRNHYMHISDKTLETRYYDAKNDLLEMYSESPLNDPSKILDAVQKTLTKRDIYFFQEPSMKKNKSS